MFGDNCVPLYSKQSVKQSSVQVLFRTVCRSFLFADMETAV